MHFLPPASPERHIGGKETVTNGYYIVTCMDARIDPAAAFGISLGDAHVIRNAGASAKDAHRSILISQQLLGTRESESFFYSFFFSSARLFICFTVYPSRCKIETKKKSGGKSKEKADVFKVLLVKHTGCGMLTFTNDDAHGIVRQNLGEIAAAEVNELDFLPFPDLEGAVKDDVELLKTLTSIPGDVTISGWVYEVETGKVRQVV